MPLQHSVGFAGDDARLLEGLKANGGGAWLAFYDRYAGYVLSVLRKVMGPDREVEDLLQEVFARALEGVHRVENPDALKAWVRSLTVFTARSTLKRRRWRKWLPLFDETDDDDGAIPYPATQDAIEERLMLKKVKALLDSLPVDDRIPLCLRLFDGLELTEIAEACDVSLATVKRRIARGEARFAALVEKERDLREWVKRARSS
ncbi:MAG: RNA polymerase sigma factor [Myxococcaceae bacterium]|nr:RNA polymerase sigma factor [Myxococcaceae bacterium]